MNGRRRDGGGGDGAPPDRDAPSVRGLLVRFASAAVVALVALVAVTAWISRRTGLQEAEADAERLAWIVAKGVVEPSLTPAVVAGDGAALDALDRVVRATVLRGSLMRVKVWDAQGRIVYSDEQRLIGRTFELDEDHRGVLAGGPTVAEVSNLQDPENAFEAPNLRLLEVYTSLTGPGGQPMALEAYFTYDTVVAAGRQAWGRYAPVSIAALVLLQLAQVPIVTQLIRRLRANQAQREALLQRSVDASAMERRRIAGDLHDGVVQELTGVSYSLSALARDRGTPDDLARSLDAAASGVRASVQGLRSLLVEIYPPNLAGEGLESALEDLTSRLSARGLSAELSVDPSDAPLPADVASLLYRGALEATRNVTSHARASTVRIALERPDGHARLSVEDDGAGFDPRSLLAPRDDGHLGMQVLSDLVADFGGHVEVESAPGRGTRIAMEVPVA